MDDAVVSRPEVMSGEPCIRGTRVPVDALLVNLAEGYPLAAVLWSYPTLDEGTVRAVLREALVLLRERALAQAGLSRAERSRLGAVISEHDWAGMGDSRAVLASMDWLDEACPSRGERPCPERQGSVMEDLE